MSKPVEWLRKNAFYLAALLIPVLCLFGLYSTTSFMLPPLSDRLAAVREKHSVENYTIQTPEGPIEVTTIRSGTEFNRILQMTGGQAVAEAGWVNQWGEEQIRMIGQAQENR
jgi:hypothetical protein